MLEAGAHFGHKAERWNPKMLPYIFGVRNRVHIINLDTTLECWQKARKYIVEVASRGGKVLFVGTKQQAREAVKEAAERCGAYYVNNRWLGGTLSNLATIRNSISRMNKLNELVKKSETKDSGVRIAKKERMSIAKQVGKLMVNLGGITEMNRQPDLVFIVDICKETIAISESLKLHIPVVALADTNSDPTKIQFPIPCNDDAVGAITLFLNAVADAVIEGKQVYEAHRHEIDMKREEQRHASDGKEPTTERRARPGNRARGAKKNSATQSGEAKAEEAATEEASTEASAE